MSNSTEKQDNTEKLATILDKEGTIDFASYLNLLKQQQIFLYTAIRNYCHKTLKTNKETFLMKMLLEDLDLCLKVYVYTVFNTHAEFEGVDEEFLHAAAVSDTRISVLLELWETWKEQNSKAILLPGAINEVEIKDIVMFNAGHLLSRMQLKDLLAPEYMVHEFLHIKSFKLNNEIQKQLSFRFCYFIITPRVTLAEYSILIDLCIKNAITPLFILYITSNELVIDKEMFKSRWIVNFVYCRSINRIAEYIQDLEINLSGDLIRYSKFYDNFKATLGDYRETGGSNTKLTEGDGTELDGGWEVLSAIDKRVFNQLVEESALGTKLTGSLNYCLLKDFKARNQEMEYWRSYAQLFGVTNKYMTLPDVNCAKLLLKAYTVQTLHPFYKMLNDAFRAGTEESVGKFRAFFFTIHDGIKKGILKKYLGFVYRGTYFNSASLQTLTEGERIYSTCFTSTRKQESVAREFARKTNRNVLLEIELNLRAETNVDIHSEQCSKYPEEEEVLLLPFSCFEIVSIFKEERLTLISLREVVPEYETMNLEGIEYGN
eukprot:TRINITY_DN6295_c0_g1_i2.p1 TRINITY_DN6295_c0_g1~~TRINITY_DN6295_c0_g1_i2.p1  ORF type:complete len:622 (-),score=147.62 TRINITY_DN6295_c0_g1_i2:56-1690(-)